MRSGVRGAQILTSNGGEFPMRIGGAFAMRMPGGFAMRNGGGSVMQTGSEDADRPAPVTDRDGGGYSL